jgi:hypothetical protein
VLDSKVLKKGVEMASFSALAGEGPEISRKAVAKKAGPISKVETPPPKSHLSNKPLAEQRRTLKLRFAQVRGEQGGPYLSLYWPMVCSHL